MAESSEGLHQTSYSVEASAARPSGRLTWDDASADAARTSSINRQTAAPLATGVSVRDPHFCLAEELERASGK